MSNNNKGLYQKVLSRVSSNANIVKTNSTSLSLVGNSSSKSQSNVNPGKQTRVTLNSSSPSRIRKTASTKGKNLATISNRKAKASTVPPNNKSNIIRGAVVSLDTGSQGKAASFNGYRSTNIVGLGPTMPKKHGNSIDSGFSFSVLSLDNNSLIDSCCELIFKTMFPIVTPTIKSLQEEQHLRSEILSFVEAIQKNYTSTNFHNFYHAVDVTQLMYTLITQYFPDEINPFVKFVLIISSLCHDISHPGGTTFFLKKHGYLNQFSSLEQFHVAETISVMKKHNLFSIRYLSENQQAEMINLTEYIIDSTDMLKDEHYRKQAIAVDGKNAFDRKNKCLCREYLAILMKLSDLANVVREFEDAECWSAHLAVEFKAMAKFDQLQALSSLDDLSINSKLNTKARSSKTDLKIIGEQLCVVQEEVRNKESESVFGNLAESTTDFVLKTVKPISVLLQKINPKLANEYSVRLRHNLEQWQYHSSNNNKKALGKRGEDL